MGASKRLLSLALRDAEMNKILPIHLERTIVVMYSTVHFSGDGPLVG